MRVDKYIRRIDALLERHTKTVYSDLHSLFLGALTIAETLYGRTSPRVKELARYEPPLEGALLKLKRFQRAIIGALEAMREDLESGLVPAPELQGSGRVLEDLTALSRSVLKQSYEVAAVLAAAAFEDTLRRLAESHLEEISKEEKLQEIVQALGKAGVLTAAEKRIASNNLAFRNQALHAKWSQINRAGVEGVLAFVDELVSKHFLPPMALEDETANPGVAADG